MGKLLGFTGDRLAHVISRYPLWEEVGEKWDYSRATGATFSEEKIWNVVKTDVDTHHVSHANRQIIRWLKRLKRSEQKSEKGIMLQMFLYYHILKISRHFASALGKFIVHANKRPSNDDFRIKVDAISKSAVPKSIAAVQQAKKWGGNDMKFFMSEMNEAVGGGAAKFLDNWRERAKKKNITSRVQLMLERRGFRGDVNVEYQDMNMLKSQAKELEEIDSQISSNPNAKSLNKILSRFESIMSTSGNEIIEMFKAAHILLRRWLFEVGIILSDEGIMRVLGPEWIRIHYMQGSLNQKITDVKEQARELSSKLHGLTNALNVHIKEMDALEDDFKRVYAEAA